MICGQSVVGRFFSLAMKRARVCVRVSVCVLVETFPMFKNLMHFLIRLNFMVVCWTEEETNLSTDRSGARAA